MVFGDCMLGEAEEAEADVDRNAEERRLVKAECDVRTLSHVLQPLSAAQKRES